MTSATTTVIAVRVARVGENGDEPGARFALPEGEGVVLSVLMRTPGAKKRRARDTARLFPRDAPVGNVDEVALDVSRVGERVYVLTPPQRSRNTNGKPHEPPIVSLAGEAVEREVETVAGSFRVVIEEAAAPLPALASCRAELDAIGLFLLLPSDALGDDTPSLPPAPSSPAPARPAPSPRAPGIVPPALDPAALDLEATLVRLGQEGPERVIEDARAVISRGYRRYEDLPMPSFAAMRARAEEAKAAGDDRAMWRLRQPASRGELFRAHIDEAAAHVFARRGDDAQRAFSRARALSSEPVRFASRGLMQSTFDVFEASFQAGQLAVDAGRYAHICAQGRLLVRPASLAGAFPLPDLRQHRPRVECVFESRRQMVALHEDWGIDACGSAVLDTADAFGWACLDAGARLELDAGAHVLVGEPPLTVALGFCHLAGDEEVEIFRSTPGKTGVSFGRGGVEVVLDGRGPDDPRGGFALTTRGLRVTAASGVEALFIPFHEPIREGSPAQLAFSWSEGRIRLFRDGDLVGQEALTAAALGRGHLRVAPSGGFISRLLLLDSGISDQEMMRLTAKLPVAIDWTQRFNDAARGADLVEERRTRTYRPHGHTK
jgi:hypothetical protein